MPKQPSRDSEPIQKTQPKKGEPVEIPVPSKPQIMRDFEKVAAHDKEDEDDKPPPGTT